MLDDQTSGGEILTQHIIANISRAQQKYVNVKSLTTIRTMFMHIL